MTEPTLKEKTEDLAILEAQIHDAFHAMVEGIGAGDGGRYGDSYQRAEARFHRFCDQAHRLQGLIMMERYLLDYPLPEEQ